MAQEICLCNFRRETNGEGSLRPGYCVNFATIVKKESDLKGEFFNSFRGTDKAGKKPGGTSSKLAGNSLPFHDGSWKICPISKKQKK